MSRIDPDHFPDRFAIDRYARRVRREETDRALHALAGWLRRLWRGSTGGLPAPRSAHSA